MPFFLKRSVNSILHLLKKSTCARYLTPSDMRAAFVHLLKVVRSFNYEGGPGRQVRGLGLRGPLPKLKSKTN